MLDPEVEYLTRYQDDPVWLQMLTFFLANLILLGAVCGAIYLVAR